MEKQPPILPHELIIYLCSIKKKFNASLLRWWEKHRRDYPWRKPGVSPFEVLIAEVLLKRTTATAAGRAYVKLLEEFPTISALAGAELPQLETLLSDIGLQRQRAKGLKEIAEYIRDEEGGKIPKDLDRLLKIPHIGPYTARAVLSFAFGVPSGVVDSNVVRVLRCVLRGFLPEKASLEVFQAVVDILVPRRKHREFNWGLLDLGALPCHYAHSTCVKCPLRKLCATYAMTKKA